MCSRECAHEWMLRRDPNYVRKMIWRRDKGICAICGVDIAELTRAINDLRVTACRSNPGRAFNPRSAWVTWLDSHGITHRRHYWDADHIVPVVEGGGGCGLDNYRILCVWCHKRETAQLARRRAEVRRRSGQARWEEV